MTGAWAWTGWLRWGLLMLLHHRPSATKGHTGDSPLTSPSIHLAFSPTARGDVRDERARAEPWALDGNKLSDSGPGITDPQPVPQPRPGVRTSSESIEPTMEPEYLPIDDGDEDEITRPTYAPPEGNLTLYLFGSRVNSSGLEHGNDHYNATRKNDLDSDSTEPATNLTQSMLQESDGMLLNDTEHIAPSDDDSQEFIVGTRTNLTNQELDYDSDEYYYDYEDEDSEDNDDYYYKYDAVNNFSSPNNYVEGAGDSNPDYYYDGTGYYHPDGITGVDYDNRTGDDEQRYNITTPDDSGLDDSDEDNQYYDNNLSDDSWMKNTGDGRLEGSEIFYGPGAHESLLGPAEKLKLSKGEPVEIHPSFLDQNSSESSLGILVFYTWIGVVTIIIIGAFIALKHRHRIATYVWDSRSGYRKETVFATEEGRNLLNHQQT